jgi:streptogramin lyase
VLLAFGAGALWTLEEGPGEVSRIDPATGKKKMLTEGASASSIAYGHRAVWLGGPIGVTRLDPDTRKPTTLPLSGLQSANSTSIAIGLDAVWFAASTQPMLFSIDTRAAGYSKYSVGSGPSGVAVSSGAVWVANSLDGTVSRVDPRTGPVATVPLGAPPGGVVAAYGRVWTSPDRPVR